ncbi:MAG: hypothetical protein AB1489_07770 [Acidobacteriota bacterium]
MKYLGLYFVIACYFYPIGLTIDSGSICIPPMPGSSGKISEPAMTPREQFIPPGSTLTIQIDNRKPLTISPQQGASIENLSLTGRHTIKIRRDNKTVTSFRFSFHKEGSSHLCLWYYQGYGSFSLRPAQDCKCK